MEKRLEKKQAVCILVNVICIKMIMTYPRIMTEINANASWLNIIYVTLLALLLFFIITKLYKPEYGNPIEAAEKIGGRVLKVITAAVFAAAFIFNMSFIVSAYIEMVKTILLIETHMSLIMIMYVLAVGIGAYFGIESISRIHAVFIPFAALILTGFFLLSVPYCDPVNLMPVLGDGVYATFGKGAFFVSIFSDLTLLLFIMSDMKTKRDIKSSGYTAIIISSIVSLLIMGTYNMIYPYPASKHFILPVYQISRLVRIGHFFQRWEAFFQFVWSIALYLYTSLYICVISKVIAQGTELKFARPLVFPVSIIIWWTSMLTGISRNMMNQIPIAIIVFAVFFCVPLFYGIIMKIKGAGKERIE